MATKELDVKIKLQRGSYDDFYSSNPVLLKGEFCVVDVAPNNVRVKIGDGTTSWRDLPYYDEDFVRSNDDIKDTIVNFSTESERLEISSGEKISTLFGKIKKWLLDLGSLAFKSSVGSSDLDSALSSDINNKALCDLYVVSLNSTSWVGSAAPWSISVTCSGVTATNNIIVGSLSDQITYNDCGVFAASQSSGTITFQATHSKPSSDLQAFIIVLK